MNQTTSKQMIERLTKHPIDCVKGSLLLDVVIELNDSNQRIQHLVSKVNRLEKEVANKGI
jgi:hypothetical protein